MSSKTSSKATETTTYAVKTASKRPIQKTEEGTGDLVGYKIADKITKTSKGSNESHLQNNSKTNENEIEIPKERYTSPEKKQPINDELRLA